MIKVKKIKPLFNAIVTTMDKYEHDVYTNGGLIDTSKQQGTVMEYQKVIAVGDMVRTIKVGDLVFINPSRYAIKKHKPGSLKDGVITDNPVVAYNLPVIEMDNVQYLLLQDQDITYVIEDYEDIPEEKKEQSKIIKPDNKIII